MHHVAHLLACECVVMVRRASHGIHEQLQPVTDVEVFSLPLPRRQVDDNTIFECPHALFDQVVSGIAERLVPDDQINSIRINGVSVRGGS